MRLCASNANFARFYIVLRLNLIVGHFPFLLASFPLTPIQLAVERYIILNFFDNFSTKLLTRATGYCLIIT